MTSKKRVIKALDHQRPDIIPTDYWAVPETTQILLKKFGLKNEEQLLRKLGIDIRYVKPRYLKEDYQEQPDGSLHKRRDGNTFVDIWGVERRKVSWGKGSYLEVKREPLAQARNVKEIERYNWPNPKDFDFKSVSKQCTQYKDYAVICTGDRLTTRASVFKLAMYLRGMDRLLKDLYLNPKLVKALVAELTKFHLVHNRMIFEAAADKIDIFMLGDDFGSAKGPMISPDKFRKFFKTPLRKLIALSKKYGLKAMLHTDGGVRELIPDFIDIGLDILNPIQTSAKGMNPHQLKKEFGQDLCFHGSVDVQHTLPFGTEEQVKTEVWKRIDALGPDGFILAPSHNLQPDVPVQNIIAMYQSAQSYTP